MFSAEKSQMYSLWIAEGQVLNYNIILALQKDKVLPGIAWNDKN